MKMSDVKFSEIQKMYSNGLIKYVELELFGHAVGRIQTQPNTDKWELTENIRFVLDNYLFERFVDDLSGIKKEILYQVNTTNVERLEQIKERVKHCKAIKHIKT